MSATAKLPEGWTSNVGSDIIEGGVGGPNDPMAHPQLKAGVMSVEKPCSPTSGSDPGPDTPPDAVVTNSDSDEDTPPAPAPDVLPLFEVRIVGLGPLAIEAVSQQALVDYITHVAFTDTPAVFAPFRVEHLHRLVESKPPEVRRSTVYIDPTHIIVVGPERAPMGAAPADEDFEALMAQFTGGGPPHAPGVILLSDETADDGEEDGPE